MECLNCKTEVPQTPKKRAKLYCSERCRIEYFRKKKPKGKPGRPKKKIESKPVHVIAGPIKEVLIQASNESAKLAIQAAIAAIKAEKIPPERDKSVMGRKSWALDQQKRIKELENQLNKI